MRGIVALLKLQYVRAIHQFFHLRLEWSNQGVRCLQVVGMGVQTIDIFRQHSGHVCHLLIDANKSLLVFLIELCTFVYMSQELLVSSFTKKFCLSEELCCGLLILFQAADFVAMSLQNRLQLLCDVVVGFYQILFGLAKSIRSSIVVNLQFFKVRHGVCKTVVDPFEFSLCLPMISLKNRLFGVCLLKPSLRQLRPLSGTVEVASELCEKLHVESQLLMGIVSLFIIV
mmetsp:Transcript_30733/g.60412  ORF Transcript_30733/g.60412 Transcript_30733/m.60412 type:complete len:228 (-) Transcript_30733:248-931(-)